MISYQYININISSEFLISFCFFKVIVLNFYFKDFFISRDSISDIKKTSSPHLPSIVPLRNRENLRTYARADTDRRYQRRDRETAAAIECVLNRRFAKENEINKESAW